MTKILPSTADVPLSVHVLEGIAQGRPLRDTAALILRDLGRRMPDGTACVLEADDRQGTARLVAAPSLPPTTSAALKRGVSVHHCTLCQTALQHDEGVRVDLSTGTPASVHEAWRPVLEHTDATTCWVQPLQDENRTLGILVVLGAPPDVDEEREMRVETALAARLLRAALQHDTRMEALQERKERFRQVTETMQEVFWLRTSEKVLYISPSFETVWGRPREDLYADPDAYLNDVHRDDVEHVREACDRMLRDHEALDLTYRIVREGGDQRWVHARFRPVQGRFSETRFAGILRDVTETIENARRLRLSEQTYRGLIDQATDAIYVQSADGRFLDVSAGAVEMYGYDRDVLIGKTPAFLSPPGHNDLDRVQQKFQQALAGSPQRLEFWGQRVDGTVFPKDIRLQRAEYFGEPVVVAFALDISERKATENALRESEKRYRLLAENVKDVVMLHDREGGTLWASPSVETILGRAPDEACALSAYDVAHPDDLDDLSMYYELLLSGKNPGPITHRVRHANGHYVWMETLVQPIYEEEGEVVRLQSCSRDVTERVRQQRELREAKRLAEDADRLKSAMLANMSHEIRTPLTAVIGFAEVLREEADPAQQHIARLVHDSSRRLMRTLDSVLQLSKLEAGLVELDAGTVHLDAEIQEAVDFHRPQAKAKRVALELDVRATEPVVGRWDAGALHRVVDNLLSNAIKFTEPGGTTRIAVRQTDTEVQLLVEDTGIGIDADFLPHIFEPFKQESAGMRRSHEGSGLGLAIVHRLVEMMDGAIEVESKKNQGTTFTVTLPFSST